VSRNDDIVRDFELWKQELKAKTEEQNMGPPELIYVEHDDYHAKYIGRTAAGVQFFAPPIFVEHSGELLGMIPSKYEDHWTVEVLPGNVMAFHEPWDSGVYDT